MANGRKAVVSELMETLRSRDERVYTYRNRPAMEYLRHANRKSGRTPTSLTLEFLKLQRGPGRMTFPEYVQYGIYDPAFTDEERRRFITNTIHWPITHRCCDMTWQATTEDSWLCARLLEGSPIVMPRTLAVIDRGTRTYPGTRTIRTPAELRDAALAHVRDGKSVFGKENRGISGFGTFLVLEADRERLHLDGEGWFSYEHFLENLVADTAYILQPVERNHAFFDRWTGHLATVRVCLFLSRNGPEVPFAVLKLPRRRTTVTTSGARETWRATSIWPPGPSSVPAPRTPSAPPNTPTIRRPAPSSWARRCPDGTMSSISPAPARWCSLPSATSRWTSRLPRRTSAHRDQYRRWVRSAAARERARILDRRGAGVLPRMRRAAAWLELRTAPAARPMIGPGWLAGLAGPLDDRVEIDPNRERAIGT